MAGDEEARRQATIDHLRRDSQYAADVDEARRMVEAIRGASARGDGDYTRIAKGHPPAGHDDFVARFLSEPPGPPPTPRKLPRRRAFRHHQRRKDR